VLWIAQVVLALAFLQVGYLHTLRFERAMAAGPRMAWLAAVGRRNMAIIGALEVLGAGGLILPPLTRMLPWLVPLAAACLTLLMVFAIIFHIPRGEMSSVGLNAVLGLLAAFVAVGRSVIAPF